MVFIEGVGYVNDSSAVATPNRTQSVSETTTNFDGMLRTETDKLNQASVTTNLDSIFKEAANKYGVSERLLKAIAYTESGFQANATSSSGAMGIMQLMPSTASAYGVSDPYDAYQNIMGGAAVLKDLLNMFQGNQSLAIAGYNAGCGNVKKYGGVPPFTETQNYVAKVTSLMQTGVSVPANTVTVNPSANTSSSSFNKSPIPERLQAKISILQMKQLFLPKQQKKMRKSSQRSKRSSLPFPHSQRTKARIQIHPCRVVFPH